MINRGSFPMWFPIDNKYLSFDHRPFAKVRVGPVYLHSVTTPLPDCIANDPVLALKPVMAG
jgi:hypothetical protein